MATRNARGLLEKTSELHDFLRRHDIQIAAITETPLLPTDKIFLQGFSIHHKDMDLTPIAPGLKYTSRRGGGVTLTIRTNIKHKVLLIPELGKIEAIAASLTIKGKQCTIVAMYAPTGKTIKPRDLNKLIRLSTSILALGDLNHYLDTKSTPPTWYVLPTNPTHYPEASNGTPDILDITIYKNVNFIYELEVIHEMHSDHLPVIATIEDAETNTCPQKPTPNYSKANWQRFNAALHNSLVLPHEINTTEELEDSIITLTKAIHTTVKNTIPHRVKKIQLKDSLPEDANNLITQHNHQSKPEDNSLWHTTKRLTRQTLAIPPLRDPHNRTASSPQEKADLLAATLELAFKPNINPSSLYQIATIERHARFQLVQPPQEEPLYATDKEIRLYLRKLSANKAPGDDGIQPIVLKHIQYPALSAITTCINGILRTKTWPTTWKTAKVILFPKPGKNAMLPQNYRPISLLSALSKVAEKVLHNRLQHHIDSNHVLPDHQFGFRAKCTTTHQLTRITEHITNAFDKKQYTAAVFLDIEKAFDHVWHEGLLHKLHSIHIPVCYLHTIASYLHSRKFFTHLPGATLQCRDIQAGVPQGSILGPTLFNVYVHDFPTARRAQIACYADDTMLFASSTRAYLAARKSEAIITTRRKIPAGLRNPQLFGTDINYKTTVKYLRVDMDTKLTWNKHFTTKVAAAYAHMSKLYPLLNVSGPMSMYNGKILYKACIRLIMIYAAPAWGYAANMHIRKIQTAQNKAIRRIAHVSLYVPTTPINRELGLETKRDCRPSTRLLLITLTHSYERWCKSSNHFSRQPRHEEDASSLKGLHQLRSSDSAHRDRRSSLPSWSRICNYRVQRRQQGTPTKASQFHIKTPFSRQAERMSPTAPWHPARRHHTTGSPAAHQCSRSINISRITLTK
ncbi:hypothetical protein PR048_026136 [Dryococelus australis]|uniref:Reverse transcriptase domain-containing protein n=1 Tax=Dryococelus australis TaxID=614101 RepID=A0ABQ9GKI1_9NEOP|nr:hypothetical protein PR048_026136 [Dryococelus australis]